MGGKKKKKKKKISEHSEDCYEYKDINMKGKIIKKFDHKHFNILVFFNPYRTNVENRVSS